ncbi:hypothetical protein BDP67DRAFT_467119 [Colletotrichum lupini]|nr:hypothetical protein BDP67DRAFT_467119 [Colletotrichum lupini]
MPVATVKAKNEGSDWPLRRGNCWGPHNRWNEQCADILIETIRLRRDYSEQQAEKSLVVYREARNRKGRILKKAL